MSTSFYKRTVWQLLKKMQHGRLTLTDENGSQFDFGQTDTMAADIRINHKDFYKEVVLYGDIGFGEAFMQGLWETRSVTSVISFMIANMAHLPTMSGSKRMFSPINLLKLHNRLLHLLKPNSLKGARKNISEHYDLSNDFFRLFLDPGMTYSCALFEDERLSLEQAQNRKYERLCKEVLLQKGNRVLEIGCGWGGFAIYAASNYGCQVTGITISREQYDYARSRVEKAGLEDSVEIVFEDYRKVTGKFDRIVSIEMIEAVGHKYMETYFRKITDLLNPDGVLGLQAIIIPDNRYDEYRKSVDWLQKHIFPGGLLPSVAKINASINRVGNLNMYSLKEMGLSYAGTLRHWFNNFKSNMESIKKLGFDDMFLRKWEYYLCCCEASFLQRNINVVQMVYARPNNPLI